MKVVPCALRDLVSCAAMVALCISANSARAAIIYNEAVSGDLPFFNVGPTLNLLIGTNDVLGNTGLAVVNDPSTPDGFRFIIPANTQLTSIEATTSPTSGALAVIFTAIRRPDFSILATSNITLPAANQVLFAPQLPLASGTYYFEIFSVGFRPPLPNFADYTLRFTVAQSAAPVPEPASLLTWLGCSLLALAARTRACLNNIGLGDKVKIIRGTLTGLIGRIIAVTNSNRCLLAIDDLPRTLNVLIPADAVHPLDDA